MEPSKLLKHNLQVKFCQYTKQLTEKLSVKEKKFVRELTKGILQSRSCIIRKIAQSHDEKIGLEDTCKRYRRHLSKDSLNLELSEQHLLMRNKGMTDDSLIIFDPSDICGKTITFSERSQ